MVIETFKPGLAGKVYERFREGSHASWIDNHLFSTRGGVPVFPWQAIAAFLSPARRQRPRRPWNCIFVYDRM